jgi:hypothetical protein
MGYQHLPEAGARTEPLRASRAPLLVSALVLVLLAAGALFVGLASDAVGTVAGSLMASIGALILLWAGVARGSGSAQRDRQD